ncbi:3045_t:CDS:1 [Funneliformis mosseae]|uniref:3045_t:CDS:1 n=1 Tax=Funneliformis mosseae TaxID=27381 RepID=A0A9N9I878_FUNMO|nr:3045_t:CDS:1 [Funneliformis mosseae]
MSSLSINQKFKLENDLKRILPLHLSKDQISEDEATSNSDGDMEQNDEADDDIFEDASSYDGNISYHDENSYNITYPQHVGLNNDLPLQTFHTLDYDNTDINCYQEFEGDIQSTQQQDDFLYRKNNFNNASI